MSAEASESPPFRDAGLMPVDLEVEARADGALLVRSRVPLASHDWNVPRAILQAARGWPDRPALARRENGAGDWVFTSYGDFARRCAAFSQWLIDRDLPRGAAVMIMGPNSAAYAVAVVGAMAAGAPAAPVSLQYAMLGGDLGRLRYVIDKIRPAVIFVEDARPVAGALAALGLEGVVVVTSTPEAVEAPGVVDLAEVLSTPVTEATEERLASLKPDHHAHYLLTSGSTGLPKVVAVSYANLAANTAQAVQATGEALRWDGRILNWLPWHHTAGASVLRATLLAGGVFYADDGKPLPGLLEISLRNLREIPVEYYTNVPLGFALLADALEADADLRRTFFSELRLMLFGGAALAQPVYDGIQRMAVEETGHRIMMTSAYGSTETTAGFLAGYAYTDKVGLGLPLPGVTLKLVPHDREGAPDARWEVRVKGPNVTRGYLDDPERTAAAFDDEGFYCMGDLATFITPGDVAGGLAFAGRLAEEFKLSTGAWVYGGPARETVLSALSPLITELVLCEENRPYLGILAWPSPEGVRRELGLELPEAIASGRLLQAMRERLATHNAAYPMASMRIARAVVLTTPPDPNAHEVSDKGSINRRGVIDNRSADVARLYADPPDAGVIVV
ncbi:AMP-binding protein [Brevundimonas sp.]|uniref:AMP-binding protein n=1 Tax=Brevundimonas sp. TaxID=1871086 RepID=UPI0035B0CF34